MWLPAMPVNTLADLAIRHQLGLFQRTLDGLHGGINIDHHALLQPTRKMLPEADHLEPAFRLQLGDNGDDFRCADIQPDDVIFIFLDSCSLTSPVNSDGIKPPPPCALPVELPAAPVCAPQIRWDNASRHSSPPRSTDASVLAVYLDKFLQTGFHLLSAQFNHHPAVSADLPGMARR